MLVLIGTYKLALILESSLFMYERVKKKKIYLEEIFDFWRKKD